MTPPKARTTGTPFCSCAGTATLAPSATSRAGPPGPRPARRAHLGRRRKVENRGRSPDLEAGHRTGRRASHHPDLIASLDRDQPLAAAFLAVAAACQRARDASADLLELIPVTVPSCSGSSAAPSFPTRAETKPTAPPGRHGDAVTSTVLSKSTSDVTPTPTKRHRWHNELQLPYLRGGNQETPVLNHQRSISYPVPELRLAITGEDPMIGTRLLSSGTRSISRTPDFVRAMAISERYRQHTMILRGEFIENLMIAQRWAPSAGEVVECGVWRGGMIRGLADMLGPDRKYHLFDSFQGLPPAQNIDGQAAIDWQQDTASPAFYDNCTADEAHARKLFEGSNFDVEFHRGWFEDTVPEVPARKPDQCPAA